MTNAFESVTPRGFGNYEFKDRYGANVALRQSSLADEPCIWIFPEVTEHLGEHSAGAHLTVDMARDVAARLNAWADAQSPERTK